MVTNVDPHAQRDDRSEADGAAGRILDGAAEAAAVSDFQYGRPDCPSRASRGVSHHRGRLAAVAGPNAVARELMPLL